MKWSGTSLPEKATAIALPVLVLACATADDAPSGPRIERSQIGDTVVVRTVSGSTWGATARLVPEVVIGELEGEAEYLFGGIGAIAVGPDGTIHVLDRQIPELRSYRSDGTFLRVLGRPGEGPGEIKQPDGGLAALSDGRVVIRDPGNGRLQVYDPTGNAAATWPARGGFFTSDPFHQTTADEVHTLILVDPDADVRDWETALVRISPDGAVGDTLRIPDTAYEAPVIEARSGNSASRTGVPFTAREVWTMHADGYFIHGVATEYAFTLLRPGAPVRVERVFEPVPVSRGERAEEERRVTMNMRRMDPSWSWNGPAIPDQKAAYQDLLAGRDGRIWVHLYAAAVEGEDFDYDPTDPDSVEDRWTEPVIFDVFEPDGTYVGRVEAGVGFQRYPEPVFDGDYVWAVREDDLGVQQVVRYRIVS